jgi:hypothetical protein
LITDRAGFHGRPSAESGEKLRIIYQQYAKTARTGLLGGECGPTKKGRDTVIPAFLNRLLQMPLIS